MAGNDIPGPNCPRCGATVASDAPDGLCPRCLIALNFVTETEIPGEEHGPTGTPVVKPPHPPAPSPEALAPHFPQLEILEVLGRGGMGAVYKARQPKLDRSVALKILPRGREEGTADTAFAERFAREARALARLNHPNIVAVHDYGEAGGYPFLVMEYVEGLTLRQLLERKKLQPEEALAIVPKICEALQFAHEKGIVHRDIKPENILLDKAGQVKITDFGIAKIIAPGGPDRPLTGAKDVVGTPHYMAPEQIEQPMKVDHRADIYSLGVVFYEMLTGELPLGKFQPPSNKVQIDVRLDEVVLHALAKEPERRYQQANEVKTDVETIAGSASSPTKLSNGASNQTQGNAGREVPGKPRDLLATTPGNTRHPWPGLPYLGLLILLAGVGWTYLWRHDPVEGRWMRPAGVFVAIIGGFLILVGFNRRQRDRTTGSAGVAATNLPFARLSRTGVLAAVWALLCAVDWMWSYTPPGWKITYALRDTLGNWIAGLVQGPLAIVAFAAPVGVTVLGWMAVNGIRRSQGRLRGLALALTDGILFPLLLVDFWLVWLCQRIGAATSGTAPSGATGAVILGVIFGLILNVILIAWLWRRIQEPLPPLRASQDSAGQAADSERSWRKLIWKVVARAALIGVVQLCLMETILQASVHRPESTGELWSMALLSSSLAAMVWAAWPLRRARSPVWAVVGATLALFVALCGLDAFYSFRLRPNLGLSEEDDWVALHPGFQWGSRQSTAKALWSKPPARPFAPAAEKVIPLDDGHPATLLDLDTGKQVSRDSYEADDGQTLAWARAEKLDLALVRKKQKIAVLGLGLGVGCVPHFVPHNELTSQAVVNFWLLDRKPAKECSDLQVATNLVGTFVFRTREGGIGLVEFAGLSDNPRGVKIRYKLVQSEVDRSSAAARFTGLKETERQGVKLSNLRDQLLIKTTFVERKPDGTTNLLSSPTL